MSGNREAGFTYLMVMFAVFLMGLSFSVVGRHWSYMNKKDREEELFFRGDQFVRAIDMYFRSAHGGANIYPQKIEDLIKDPRSLSAKRYLRRMYKDPFTGEADWILIREKESGRIKGVKSRSEDSPIKLEGFPEVYKHLRQKSSYNEWEFIHKPGMFK